MSVTAAVSASAITFDVNSRMLIGGRWVDAQHGWTQTDFPIYDKAAAERHWEELFALFARNLID